MYLSHVMAYINIASFLWTQFRSEANLLTLKKIMAQTNLHTESNYIILPQICTDLVQPC